ncbi:carbohydrate ABC transporter permease [Paraburkholderia sp. BR14263]|uniref:carbohydrate ABC transporter permease n=3 Tax=Paraburkholderia TaxID=1822464 RepID=UPI0034CEE23A
MKPSARFPGRQIPLMLALPQLLLVALFFYWPACKAVWWSFNLVRPFGNGSIFVGLDNYVRILSDATFYASLRITAIFAVAGVGSGVLIALALAGFADLNLRGSAVFRNLLIWPYAIAGATLGVIMRFIANPVVGPLAYLNTIHSGLWTPQSNGSEAIAMITLAFAWTQVPFNFVIFVAALRSIPQDYLAAAAVDGAGPVRRFFDIKLPMLKPFILFVTVASMIEAMTNSFGIVDTLTAGGPAGATNIIAYKIYSDGFVGLDLSGSSTLSVILMFFIIAMTFVQFRVSKRKLDGGN